MILIFSVCAVVLLFAYCFSIDRRLSYAKAYWRYECCHFLAGFFVALGAFSVIQNRWTVFFIVFGLGLLWEVYEYLLEIPSISRVLDKKGIKHGPWTLADTFFDLVLDSAGAAAFLILVGLF